MALASKPFDIFFLCKVPVLNLDNKYNEMALQGCNEAKGKWLTVVSRQEEGHDDYEIVQPIKPRIIPDAEMANLAIRRFDRDGLQRSYDHN